MYLSYRRIESLISFCAAETSLHGPGQRVSFIELRIKGIQRLQEAAKTGNFAIQNSHLLNIGFKYDTLGQLKYSQLRPSLTISAVQMLSLIKAHACVDFVFSSLFGSVSVIQARKLYKYIVYLSSLHFQLFVSFVVRRTIS